MKFYQRRIPNAPADTEETLINATYAEFAERHPGYAANIGEWWYGECETVDGVTVVSLHAPASICPAKPLPGQCPCGYVHRTIERPPLHEISYCGVGGNPYHGTYAVYWWSAQATFVIYHVRANRWVIYEGHL